MDKRMKPFIENYRRCEEIVNTGTNEDLVNAAKEHLQVIRVLFKRVFHESIKKYL